MLGSVLKLVMFYLYQSSRPSPSQEGQPLWLNDGTYHLLVQHSELLNPIPSLSIKHQTSDINANTYTHILTYCISFLYIYIYILYIIYIILYIHICIYLLRHLVICTSHPQPPSHTPLPGTSSTRSPSSAVVVDPVRTCASGKVDIGAFRTYPAGHTPADARRRCHGCHENLGKL